MPPKYKKQRIETELVKINVNYPIVNTLFIDNKLITLVTYF